MRTTLDLDDDVLRAAKELARQQKRSAGKVVSSLLREALMGQVDAGSGQAAPPQQWAVGGFRPFDRQSKGQGQLVTDAQVDALRDQLGI
ncbi:MAG: CopG family transcriptional regulator [Cyanobacteriota bacterium]|nr:CopG family transcriptional regulator [Cyanobacteriota bacterium]